MQRNLQSNSTHCFIALGQGVTFATLIGPISQSVCPQQAVKPSVMKHSSSLGPFICYEENEVLNPVIIFKTLHFLRNIRMGQMSQSASLPQTAQLARDKHSSFFGLLKDCAHRSCLDIVGLLKQILELSGNVLAYQALLSVREKKV